ncbi:MAG: hypothetical protein FD170_1402 [Bacteroidetes bacterium]|nr:MAG: hypothetical protein FD170_1402 [Bacteroidota bacterium]
MQTWIVLLRGINVSGKNLIKMSALTQALSDSGLNNIRTYIQSGNIIFESEETNPDVISGMVSNIIKARFEYDVPAIAILQKELLQISKSNPFFSISDFDPAFMYITFLHRQPENEKIEAIEKLSFLPDIFSIQKNAVYVYCPNGYGKTKINNSFFERKLGVMATTRNIASVEKLCYL